MLKIVQRKGSPYYYLRGTVRGIPVYESTRTDRRDFAEEIRIKREAELLERSVHGAKAVATYIEAAVMYMEAGGERRFQQPLIDHFRGTKLGRINQAAIDRSARVLYPDAGPASIHAGICRDEFRQPARSV